jgi:signal transduction histidine kinase
MRVYEMISDMMLFARPPKPKLAQCDISQAIASLLAELAPAAEARRVELESEIGHEPLMIRADREQLGVVLRSLAENALEAMSHGGRLQVAARRSTTDWGELPARECLEITVRDNGPGIPPDVRPHLFDPFYSGRAAGRGLGLGLSKSWRIVANHGGRIDVESEFGRGAAFIVRLPA